jgi:hypothetical protein
VGTLKELKPFVIVIPLSSSVKYWGLIIEKGLTWNLQLENAMK